MMQRWRNCDTKWRFLNTNGVDYLSAVSFKFLQGDFYRNEVKPTAAGGQEVSLNTDGGFDTQWMWRSGSVAEAPTCRMFVTVSQHSKPEENLWNRVSVAPACSRLDFKNSRRRIIRLQECWLCCHGNRKRRRLRPVAADASRTWMQRRSCGAFLKVSSDCVCVKLDSAVNWGLFYWINWISPGEIWPTERLKH